MQVQETAGVTLIANVRSIFSISRRVAGIRNVLAFRHRERDIAAVHANCTAPAVGRIAGEGCVSESGSLPLEINCTAGSSMVALEKAVFKRNAGVLII